jgi:hypothetical protein
MTELEKINVRLECLKLALAIYKPNNSATANDIVAYAEVLVAFLKKDNPYV